MTRGLFIALAIMAGCGVLPLIQAFGPFIAGYFGIRLVPAGDATSMVVAVKFGALVGAAAAAILVTAALIVMSTIDMPSHLVALMWISVGVAASYAASMCGLGALYQLRKLEAARLAGETAG